jgi:hypothetical protein
LGIRHEAIGEDSEAPARTSALLPVPLRVACVLLGICCVGSLLLHKSSELPAPAASRGSARIESQVEYVEMKAAAVAAAAPVPAGPSPFLFCWSHLEVDSYELSLIRLQLVKRASIFACNEAAVISTRKILLGNVDGNEVWTWYNPAKQVEMGTRGVDGATTDSFLNTETFIIAWDTLMHSGHMWPHDFVVKVDPDAVFMPDRLRQHVLPHLDEAVYFSNCGKYGGEVLLYGSVEVFSVPALRMYQERITTCKRLPWKGWGEDYYMQHCMNALGVANIPDEEQVGDDRCISAKCSDYTKVAFHDFKTPEDWYDCFQEAIR